MVFRSEEYYSPTQIAQGLFLSRVTVRNWIKSGKLQAAKISRKVNRVSGKDLLEMLAASSGKGGVL